MKQIGSIVFFLITALFSLNSTYATQHIILAEGTTLPTDIFTPSITYAVVGDTIVWVWVDGIHTTESVTIPPGATSWAGDLDSSADTFMYVVTIPGTYYFDCHASIGGHGMDGYIEVSAATGIGSIGLDHTTFAFPNPFKDEVVFDTQDADEIRVYNIVGQEVISTMVARNSSTFKVDTKALPSGFYFFSTMKSGRTVATKKLTKS